jgi:hypothetical protein
MSCGRAEAGVRQRRATTWQEREAHSLVVSRSLSVECEKADGVQERCRQMELSSLPRSGDSAATSLDTSASICVAQASAGCVQKWLRSQEAVVHPSHYYSANTFVHMVALRTDAWNGRATAQTAAATAAGEPSFTSTSVMLK